MRARSTQILSFLGAFYLFRLVLVSRLPLALDEAHYWFWSQHLQLSYFDHPPMVAYMIAASTWIAGHNELGVRLGGIVLSVLTLWLLFRTVRTLAPDERDSAWEVLGLVNVTLLFAAGVVVQTPDTPLVLCWTAALYCGSRIVQHGSRFWWYGLGIALGLGLLSKYNMILFVPCFGAFIVLSPGHRYWIRRQEPYLALGLALLVFSPVVIWNWQHDWISFAFQMSHGFSPGAEPLGRKLLKYTSAQAGVISPLLFLGLLFYCLWGAWRGLRRMDATYLYLALMSWPILLFFALSSARGEVASANWPGTAYLAGLILMWLVYRRHFAGRLGHRVFMAAALGTAAIFVFAVHAHLMQPFLPMAPRKDTTKQFRGWPELGANINAQIDGHPAPQGYFLVADRGLTTLSEAIFYTDRGLDGLDFFRPEELTFLAGKIDDFRGRNAIILLDPRKENPLERYGPFFESVRLIGKNSYRYRGEPLARLELDIALGESFRGNWRPEIP